MAIIDYQQGMKIDPTQSYRVSGPNGVNYFTPAPGGGMYQGEGAPYQPPQVQSFNDWFAQQQQGQPDENGSMPFGGDPNNPWAQRYYQDYAAQNAPQAPMTDMAGLYANMYGASTGRSARDEGIGFTPDGQQIATNTGTGGGGGLFGNIGHIISQFGKNNPDPLDPASTSKRSAIGGLIRNPSESSPLTTLGSPTEHNVDIASLGPLAASNPAARGVGRVAGIVAGLVGGAAAAGAGGGAGAGAGADAGGAAGAAGSGGGAAAGGGALTGGTAGSGVTSGLIGGADGGAGLGGAVGGGTAAGGGAATGGGLTAGNVLQGGALANNLLNGGSSGTSTSGGGALSGLVGGGLSLAGANQALQAYEEAQRSAEAAGQFTPYNVHSGLSDTTFANGTATSSLSPQYQALRDQYLGNASAGASAAGAFDPNQAATQLYGQLQAQAAPGEATARANALAQLQGMGQIGLGVGDVVPGSGSAANPLYASLLKAQSDASLQRQNSAYGTAQTTADQLQQRALGWAGAGTALDTQAQQGIQQGAALGTAQSNAALGGARLAQMPIINQGALKGGVLSGVGTSLLGPGGLGGALTGIGNSIGNLFPGSGSGTTTTGSGTGMTSDLIGGPDGGAGLGGGSGVTSNLVGGSDGGGGLGGMFSDLSFNPGSFGGQYTGGFAGGSQPNFNYLPDGNGTTYKGGFLNAAAPGYS